MYTITLQDFPADIPERAKHEAERRFQRTLEKVLGGPDEVLSAYRAWQAAEDSSEADMAVSEIELAKRWIGAATRAHQDAFRDLGELEAWFEVRVEK